MDLGPDSTLAKQFYRQSNGIDARNSRSFSEKELANV